MNSLGTRRRNTRSLDFARDDRFLGNYWRMPHISKSEKDGEPGARRVCSRGPGEKN
jgi:hypothetical protein